MKQYKRIIEETVKAVQYTGKESEDLVELLGLIKGLYFYNYNHLYIINKSKNKQVVKKNDYIVLRPNGDLIVLPPFEFELLYCTKS